MMGLLVGVAVVAMVFSAGCPDESQPEAISELGPDVADESETLPPPELAEQDEAIRISSPAFRDGEAVPEKYTADGENVSPPLEFAGVPDNAEELALVLHDPDAPVAGGFTHWVVYGMAPDLEALPEGVSTDPSVDDPALKQGTNSGDEIGYTGPAPPPGSAHHYNFTLYVLSEKLDLEPGATKDELEAAMQDTVIRKTMLTGIYSR